MKLVSQLIIYAVSNLQFAGFGSKIKISRREKWKLAKQQ